MHPLGRMTSPLLAHGGGNQPDGFSPSVCQGSALDGFPPSTTRISYSHSVNKGNNRSWGRWPAPWTRVHRKRREHWDARDARDTQDHQGRIPPCWVSRWSQVPRGPRQREAAYLGGSGTCGHRVHDRLGRMREADNFLEPHQKISRLLTDSPCAVRHYVIKWRTCGS